MSERPLAGVRVVDFTRVLSGPHCTRMLCDLGADVVKVEPPEGDVTRFSLPRINGLASYFVQQNVGKRNVSIDLAHPQGRDVAMRLIDAADVVVENFRPGVMDRLGLSYHTVAARNPRLVYASISGYGQTGMWATRRAYAPAIGAESGWTKAQGDATGHYSNDPHSNADLVAGMHCATAILAALVQRERTGRGDRLDVTMLQSMLYVNEHVHNHLWDRSVPEGVVRSFGNADYPVLTVANGEQIIVSGHPAENGTFEGLVSTMDRPDLGNDPRLATMALRLQHLDEWQAEIDSWAASVPDAATAEAALARHGVTAGVVRSVVDVAASEWAAEREAIVAVDDRNGGTVRVPNVPWVFEHSDVRLRGLPRYRGEDNAEVLGELGYTTDEIDALSEAGALSRRVPELPG